MNPESPDQLERLFARYREACPEVEPSANFMPNVWARIDAKRGWMWHLRAYSRRMAVATAAACMLLVGIQIGATWNHDPLISQSYVDILRDSAATEDYAYVPVVEIGERF
jgi:hypothetical protein